jgi:MFS superfamily sulfate permease-like transporter
MGIPNATKLGKKLETPVLRQILEKTRLKISIKLVIVILLGLLSRRFPMLLPSFLGKYPGDALWAVMVFYMVLLIFQRISIKKAALAALLISYADEFSQLYHSASIDAVRSTTVGHLILGSQFSWLDLLAYGVGIAFIAAIELFLSSKSE